MQQADRQLIVHRDSRTEKLAELLADALARSRPENPLAAQTLVVAHPGLKRWLLGEFARHGERGIAANFDMILPWQWLERCASELLGDDALVNGAYSADALRWVIYAVLPTLDAAPVRAYLRGDNAPRRRFKLADHLAGVYTQYLIYRPDWILAWERGEIAAPWQADDWQAELWRQLRRRIAQPHRAQRRDALLQALHAHGDGATLPLHVFGVSHLQSDVLDALQVLSAHREVHLYFPDPCRQYWADLRTPRELLRLQPDGEDLYYEIGHPLLVSLGRMAQDFFIRLDTHGAELGAEESGEVTADTLLGTVQESIRDCRPGLVGAAPARLSDASLRFHACHTRLRELEVLKDALLDRLSADPTLQHRDIVVMAPNVEAYAPYLAAVFGEAAHYSNDPAQIPWHLADVGLALTHPLISAFSRLLDLAESRFAVSEIMDFLDVPALARRFDIDAADREALERWLRRTRVAWGLDAQMKADSGAAAIETNSWKFGFDRLYAGLIVGSDPSDTLLDGIFPAQGVSGSAIEAIGSLDRLLATLRRARSDFADTHTLDVWCEHLQDLIDALFLADPRDDAEISALDNLRRGIAAMTEQADAPGRETVLPWSVVREVVRGALDEQSRRQPFLLGGVTFCGLVPQRSIPFRMVCVLGMNEGEFPRTTTDAGFNHMLAHPRRGDRDTRNEDRYLFLEALMAARDCLHISFIGEGVRDGKSRNPASPLAELLQFLDEQHGLGVDGKLMRPWFVRHPLQPFDSRYFLQSNDSDADGNPRHDPRLFSYSRAFVKTDESVSEPAAAFVNLASLVTAWTPGGDVSLAALKRFWRDPAKAFLRDDLGLSLDALDTDVWPDREALETRPDPRDRIERRLLFDALDRGCDLPIAPPLWLARSGILAAGAIGAQTWTQARARTQAVLALARELLGHQPQRLVQSIDVAIDSDVRLLGVAENVYR
ncbi:MAG: exodeoxyribonuclease V subunit gamma, partial [Rudaea sp.]